MNWRRPGPLKLDKKHYLEIGNFMNVRQIADFSTQPEVKRKWLISLGVITGMRVFSTILDFVMEQDVLKFLLVFPVDILFGYFNYYCSYKMGGTKLLTFNLIMMFMGSVATLAWVYDIPTELLVAWIIMLPIEIYFGINCYRLRKYNKEMAALQTAS